MYATGFFLWGVVANRTIVSLLAVFEGAGFSLLFTSILVVGKLLPSSLYSSGNSLGAMVGFGIGPILGAGIGGIVYDELGSLTLFVGSAVLAAAGGVAALLALRTPALDTPSTRRSGRRGGAARARPDLTAALTCVLCSGAVPRDTMGGSGAPAGGRNDARREERDEKSTSNGSNQQQVTQFVDKAKEVAGSVAEKAGPVVVKAKEVAGSVAEKAGPWSTRPSTRPRRSPAPSREGRARRREGEGLRRRPRREGQGSDRQQRRDEK